MPKTNRTCGQPRASHNRPSPEWRPDKQITHKSMGKKRGGLPPREPHHFEPKQQLLLQRVAANKRRSGSDHRDERPERGRNGIPGDPAASCLWTVGLPAPVRAKAEIISSLRGFVHTGL
ncbi:hypothetical protein HPB50_003824 [Hyalomma asiaticum]|uniref:Uncharacterized protein n=1 Tax=Hyalomma asiaticum TaxID=266040 RepID=A0ACB7TEF9_HYAAI|nr:hypothetical protein HPB50_003824 [Hyalomma asiaticum]